MVPGESLAAAQSPSLTLQAASDPGVDRERGTRPEQPALGKCQENSGLKSLKPVCPFESGYKGDPWTTYRIMHQAGQEKHSAQDLGTHNASGTVLSDAPVSIPTITVRPRWLASENSSITVARSVVDMERRTGSVTVPGESRGCFCFFPDPEKPICLWSSAEPRPFAQRKHQGWSWEWLPIRSTRCRFRKQDTVKDKDATRSHKRT